MIFSILAIAILLILSAFFSASETAFTSLSEFQVEETARKDIRRGKALKEMYSKPETFIATVLICNNLVNISLSAVVTELTIKLWGSRFIGIATGILTLLVLVFGEVTPKNIAIIRNEPIALFTAPAFKILSKVLRPVIFIINRCSSFFTNLIGSKEKKALSADMIYNIVKSAADKGVVKDYEQRMVYGVFSLGSSTLKNIITHRTDVVSMDQELTVHEAIATTDSHRFSKYPLYSGEKENITGIVRTSRIIAELRSGNGGRRLNEIKEEPLYLQESRRISDVFRLMKRTKKHFAIVLDEYGGFTGIVNLDDIVNLVLGEFYHLEEADTEKIEEVSEDEYVIFGEAPVATVSEKLRIELPWYAGIRTIGGLIVKKLDRIPNAGEVVSIDGSTFLIEEVSDRQVLKIRYRKQKNSD